MEAKNIDLKNKRLKCENKEEILKCRVDELEKGFSKLVEDIVEFINELAWQDVKYDAFQSTMGEFPGSLSAVPRYAKKYFDLWNEMFDFKLKDLV